MWTGPRGPGPGPENLPRTWTGPDLGQSNRAKYELPKSSQAFRSFGCNRVAISRQKVLDDARVVSVIALSLRKPSSEQ